MIKFVLRMGCLTLIAAAAFVVVAVLSGGEKFRWIGDKVGGIVKKTTGELGERADRIKDTGDKAKKTFDRISRPEGEGKER